ncbi:GMC family oxidoreductase N-terminal domain-containing protein [Cryptosporangium aurantiacum]|uniref:Cholesterol oxidase n=1 Tax=Cryptosporangium aurantiacum TaxID=134849 RepID=A0A1M7QVW3_9ACTN|nr:GMC family oxidoreductase [Cryptosporangium aurantiacum]SHN35764.1 cholesterol oxidase [Cryptosporangium aurantiacum]
MGNEAAEHFDVVVIGSGFGGSVSALRLTEKGYRVAVLEAGRRFTDDQLPKTSWDVRKYLWAPKLGCYGIQRITLLKDVLVLAGAGVGGGSLVYANTLYEPPQAFYDDPQWRHITDWKTELAPYYDQAKRMLGVRTYPHTTPADQVMQKVAAEMGVGDSYHPTPVGVFFGEPGAEVDDPYFGGAGPRRSGCTNCGACMTGCRVNAKNTLVKNYLYLAESNGAQIFDRTTATAIRPLEGGGYAVDTVRTGWGRRVRTFTAGQVVVAASALGTQRLLHACRDSGHLPGLSSRLGLLARTNSEALLGANRLKVVEDDNFADGVAITSSFHPDADTHIEPVRYGRGSNFMGMLTTVLPPPAAPGRRRWPGWLKEMGRNLHKARHLLWLRHWSERTIILLVMQSVDNSLTTFTKKTMFGRRKMTTRQGHGAPNPTYIPAGHEATRRTAAHIGGMAGGTLVEAFDVPMTAHFIGGCAIGDSPETGVVDAYHRVYGYPGLHVVDGAALSANLGVNPSLSITAQAERAMALWPNKGEADTRPPQSEPYRPLAPVPPVRPAVPDAAEGALRLPLIPVEALTTRPVDVAPSAASSQPTPADAAQVTAEEVPPATVDR